MPMRERLKQLRYVLQLDFQKARLSWVLGTINILLVILVIAVISFSAVGLLRKLADEQGLVRVELAGATAREEMRRISEDLLTAARSLAARPTLRRMAVEESASAVEIFLRRACQAAGADACLIVQNGVVLSQSSPELNGKEILAARSEQGERFMVAPASPALPLLGAVALVDGASDGNGLFVYALRSFDAKLAARLAERTGLAVRLVSYRSFTPTSTDQMSQLHTAALSDGRSASARIEGQRVFASSFPVFAATGEAIALIETRLPADELDASVHALIYRLWITALILGGLAVAAAVWLGKQVADPVRELTNASARLGQGDFSTSIPVEGAAEVRVLARTMEDMRRNLVDLTTTLRQREAEAQAVLNGIVEGVYAVDRSRKITYLNPQAARLLNVDPQEAIGKFCGDVLKPCAVNGERPCERQCPILFARGTGNARSVEHLQVTDAQPRTTVLTSAAPVDGLQVQVIRDETDLEAARRARDTVLANISHEFRTPLAAQLASIELLRDGWPSMTDAQRQELVMSLVRGTHRLTRLIDNLLESVRIESGQLAIRHQTVELVEIIEDAHNMVAPLLELRKQRFETAIPEDLPTIDGDGPRLTQVLVNLLANANKYAPENSIIRVGAERSTSTVKFWVEDEGEGVPEGSRESIFDRFSRGKDEEPEPGGLGLGLWIVKSIVERHGGSVKALRTAQGRTRFVVELPGVEA